MSREWLKVSKELGRQTLCRAYTLKLRQALRRPSRAQFPSLRRQDGKEYYSIPHSSQLRMFYGGVAGEMIESWWDRDTARKSLGKGVGAYARASLGVQDIGSCSGRRRCLRELEGFGEKRVSECLISTPITIPRMHCAVCVPVYGVIERRTGSSSSSGWQICPPNPKSKLKI